MIIIKFKKVKNPEKMSNEVTSLWRKNIHLVMSVSTFTMMVMLYPISVNYDIFPTSGSVTKTFNTWFVRISTDWRKWSWPRMWRPDLRDDFDSWHIINGSFEVKSDLINIILGTRHQLIKLCCIKDSVGKL